MRVRPYGDHALLIDCPDPAALRRRLLGRAGLVDLVPGRSDLLVVADGAELLGPLATELSALAAPVDPPAAGRLVELPVRYDGADLEAVATACGLTRTEVVDLHAGADYTVSFLGFLPGFPYLTGLPVALHLPRRADPRPAVPAGAVAIAEDVCGIYPRPSPGGWHLIGSCDVALFDPAAEPAALLAPGDRVRLRPVA